MPELEKSMKKVVEDTMRKTVGQVHELAEHFTTCLRLQTLIPMVKDSIGKANNDLNQVVRDKCSLRTHSGSAARVSFPPGLSSVQEEHERCSHSFVPEFRFVYVPATRANIRCRIGVLPV